MIYMECVCVRESVCGSVGLCECVSVCVDVFEVKIMPGHQ